MRFCPDCGVKLSLKQTRQSQKSNRLEYLCPNCGHLQINSLNTVESNTAESNTVQEKIVVIDEEAMQLRTLPTTNAKCSKCENNLAYFWLVQTRSGDEGSTQFFRCTKCNYTWRLYT